MVLVSGWKERFTCPFLFPSAGADRGDFSRDKFPKTFPIRILLRVREMSRFIAECPIDGCDFQVESYWRNTARGKVILHAYRTGGGGHGEEGSRPETDFEIRVERRDGK